MHLQRELRLFLSNLFLHSVFLTTANATNLTAWAFGQDVQNLSSKLYPFVVVTTSALTVFWKTSPEHNKFDYLKETWKHNNPTHS